MLEFVGEQVRAGMEELAVPGVALGVVAGDREETACFGVTSLENPLEVTPDTIFQIGSIGKTYLAAAVMRLVERGELDLDEPVRRYLPDFRLADDDAAARSHARSRAWPSFRSSLHSERCGRTTTPGSTSPGA